MGRGAVGSGVVGRSVGASAVLYMFGTKVVYMAVITD